MVDRGQAESRALSAEAIVAPLDYRLARAPLPALCLALMQNPDATDVDDMSKKVSSLDARTDMSLDAKMMVLGVYLMRVVGREVLQSSVSALGKLITRSGLPPTGMASDVADLLGGLDFGKVKASSWRWLRLPNPE